MLLGPHARLCAEERARKYAHEPEVPNFVLFPKPVTGHREWLRWADWHAAGHELHVDERCVYEASSEIDMERVRKFFALLERLGMMKDGEPVFDVYDDY